MSVTEVRKPEVRLIKHAVETGKASVESATAGAGVVWGVEVNMIDFRCKYDDGFVRLCCGCFETLMLVRWRNRCNVTSNDVVLETCDIVLVRIILCWF